MEDANLMMIGMLFGSIGFGYFVYGKKKRAFVPLICGVCLSVIPYVIPNIWGMVLAGVVLMALPRFVRL